MTTYDFFDDSNLWVEEDIPEFHFVSLGSHVISPTECMVFDGITVDYIGGQYLYQDDWAFLK